ncbi:hypothetical protein DUNSADRAFT_2246, partial [Dunaliella salina]
KKCFDVIGVPAVIHKDHAMQAKTPPLLAQRPAQRPAHLCLFPPCTTQLRIEHRPSPPPERAQCINIDRAPGHAHASPPHQRTRRRGPGGDQWEHGQVHWPPQCRQEGFPAPSELYSNHEQQRKPPSHPQRFRVSRRSILQAGGVALLPACAASAQTPIPDGVQQALPQPGLSRQACLEKYLQYLTAPDYWKEGPLRAVRLPIKLSHVLTSCYSSGFAGTSCQVKFDMFYPKGGATLGLGPPYPLALITSGFFVSSEAYKSYAQRLASWGYAVLLYDKQETMSDILDDVTSVAALRQCIDLASSDPLIKRVADPSR